MSDSVPSFDFPAVLLDQEFIKRLHMLLSPADVLERDVRSLAGLLNFTRDEVLYLFQKSYPFVYMYDQWIKREGRSATLKVLLDNLHKLRRLDAAEIVEKAMKELHDRDPKEVMKIEEKYFSTLRRTISCSTLFQGEGNVHSLAFEQNQNESCSGKAIPSLLKPKPKLIKKDENDHAPHVFVVYSNDNHQHLKNVIRFIKHLRKCGIDATADMFESLKSEKDRGFYFYSNLLEAEYVFVVCSAQFIEHYEKESRRMQAKAIGKETEDTDDLNENAKEVSFIMKLILDDIFDKGGRNAKYIPVLLPKGLPMHVPSILKCSTIYKMPHEYDDLKRRVFKVEKYKLAPIKKDCQLQSNIIHSRSWFFKK